MEIERKFWIQSFNNFSYERCSVIEQIYINHMDDFYEIRIRKYYNDNKFYLDFKSKGDLERDEFGIKITEEQYEKILSNFNQEYINNNSILKKRYYISEGLFFDEYLNNLKGLYILEYEADSENVKNFVVPNNFNYIEVTYDKRFKNRHLIGKTYEFIKDITMENEQKNEKNS